MIRTRGLTTPYRMRPGEIDVFVGSIREALRVDGAFVEIGIHRALGTRCLLEILAREHATRRLIFGIDTREDAIEAHRKAFEDLDPDGVHERWSARGLSQNMLHLVGAPVAWAYVDGCHCMACVSEDVRLLHERIMLRGLMVLHDTSVHVRHARSCCQRTLRDHAGEVALAIAGSVLVTDKYALAGIHENAAGPGIRAYRRVA